MVLRHPGAALRPATGRASTSERAPIECVDVVKRFGRLVALDRLTFSVTAGRVVGYLGPNGAGKSTTIRLLLDLARPDAGHVRVFGQEPRRAGAALRRRIGYLAGELRLDDRLTVAETLRLWSRLRGLHDADHVRRLCERLDLDPGRATRGLSTGNRRKVGIVGAFMGRPDLLVLDEPTAGIDPLVQAEVLELVREARDDGRTVFLSSHVLTDVQRVADDVVVLRAGRVVATGSVETLRGSTRQPFAVTFAGPVPEDELREVGRVVDLEVRGCEARGVVEGDPNGLLAVLSRHPVHHLVMPEPDLEEAFLGYYEQERR